MKKVIEHIRRKINKKSLVNSVNIRESGRIYEALTPTDDIGHGEEYLAALGWALSQTNIHNIAVSGPYGSGKSSAIKTYLKRYEDNEVVYISLAAFDLKEAEGHGEPDIQDANKKINEEKLEAAILKQLFYSVDGKRIPQSRYRKLQAGKNWKSIWVAVALAIIIPAILCFSFPKNTQDFIDWVNAFGGHKTQFIYGVLAIAAFYVLACVVDWFRRSGSIKEIKILDKATLGSAASSEESIFNKNMDEIVYFFESTKKKIVIIEDLDRFENSSIFVALRELNSVINNNEKINGTVKFVYAIKDDMFKKPGERTKFFDFIIPIVPYISSVNSGEILREKMNMASYDISDKYISLVSPYISDMRDLMSICNEFNVFKNTLKGKQKLNLIDENMLSLVIYKNLYPNDFAELENESASSLIRIAFKNKRNQISKQNELINKKKQNEKEILAEIEHEALKSIKELKLALLNSLIGFESAVYMVYVANKQYTLKNILQDDFDVELLKKSLNVYWMKPNISSSTSISNPEEVVKQNGDYFTRIERVRKGLAKSKNDSRCAVEEYERKINEMKSYSMKQIIAEFGTDFLDDNVKENDLLVFMLRNGYIEENFENYINYFHPNSITKEDMNFILGIRNHRSVGDYTYTISNPERVYAMLQDYEFKQIEVFNYDMVDYVLENGSSLAVNNLFEKLKDQSQESMDFIKAFVERDKHLDVFFKRICEDNDELWDSLVADGAITKEKQYKYLVNMLKYADIEDIASMDMDIEWVDDESDEEDDTLDSLTGLLTSDVESLKKISEAPSDKVIALIEKLEIEFSDVDIQGIDENIQNFIIENWAYVLNSKMLHRLFALKKPEYEGRLDTQNYTAILEGDFKPLTEYVQDKRFFGAYIKDVVLGMETNTQESIESIEDILERLSDKSIDLCLHLLEKENAVWDDVSMCLASEEGATETKELLWKKLLECDKIKPSWENYIAFYNMFGPEKELGSFFERHIDEFLSDADNEVITDEIIIGLLHIDLSGDDFRRCIQEFEINNYADSISSFDKEKISILIEENALLFSVELWEEMGTAAPELRIKYAKSKTKEFIKAIDQIELHTVEINEILVDNEFSEADKMAVLGTIEAENLEVDTALILKDISFSIGRTLTDAAWNILETGMRYALLLNQISLFEDNELAIKFSELDEVYHTLSDRSKHKFKLADTKYNKELLAVLAQRGYITSFQSDKDGNENVLVGFVKQMKSTTVVAN